MTGRARILRTCLGACAVLALAPAAPAGSDAAAPTAVASKLPAKVGVSVPPGGSATVGSPDLGPSLKTIALDVAPTEDDAAFEQLRLFMSSIPTPGQRLLACVYIFRGLVHGLDTPAGPIEGDVEDEPLATLFMAMCAQMAVTIDKGTAGASAAAAGCNQQRRQIAVKVTRRGSRYDGRFSGTVRATKTRPALKITCARKGRGYTLRVRPRKKGASLRSVVGSRLRLGFQSPPDATSSAQMRVTFRK